MISASLGIGCILSAFLVSINIVAPTEAVKVQKKLASSQSGAVLKDVGFEVKKLDLTTSEVKVSILVTRTNQEPLYLKFINNDEVLEQKELKLGENNAEFYFTTDDVHELVIQDSEIRYRKLLEPYLVLRFTGDVNLSSRFESVTNKKGADYLWRKISPLLKTADISFLNLETSVSERGKKIKDRLFFRTKPENMRGLVTSGVDLVSVANNHTYDYGPVAFKDTLNFLTDNNVLYAGGGNNLEEALEVKYITKKGVKIGFIAFNQVLSAAWGANESKAGQLLMIPQSKTRILNAIKAADENCDQLVVMTHWGIERAAIPKEETRVLAKLLIDSGADLIVGTHPHVLQGVEVYKNKPIYYSVGNSIFTNKDEMTAGGAIFELKLNKDGYLGAKFYPTYIERNDFKLLNKKDKRYQGVIDDFAKNNIFNVKVHGNRLLGI